MQSDDLTGDFHLQNFDAVDPGSLAPWYARFGHTLDVLNVTDHSGVTVELMILAGGYTPDPDNDVWVTEDGSESWVWLLIAGVLSLSLCTYGLSTEVPQVPIYNMRMEVFESSAGQRVTHAN